MNVIDCWRRRARAARSRSTADRRPRVTSRSHGRRADSQRERASFTRFRSTLMIRTYRPALPRRHPPRSASNCSYRVVIPAHLERSDGVRAVRVLVLPLRGAPALINASASPC